ncbi:hypothetical protein [uncultured Kiloniella sp.]|uniref:hypothetical protein n=1 Tax=uncultured Kiloniella sp. TaxID=1133091 RepID=UPI00260C7DF3|nr:hypothetical protein [uncultured Kiloniella sp.]
MERINKNTLIIVVSTSTTISMAQGIATLAQGWASTISALQVLLVICAALVGLASMAAGAVQLKKHGENPQQVPLNKGLLFLASGALLFGLSATSTTMIDTVFGSESGDLIEVKTEF